MGITSTIKYKGELRTHATHKLSGTEIITDAPIDNFGKGASFSPTDLVCTALGSCMITLMGIAAQNHSINLGHIDTQVEKIMSTQPRKISQINIHFDFENTFSDKEKTILRHAALTCPVGLSLNSDIKQQILFSFD